ncbi:MAG: molecular chaperone DnaJ [Proteobacteria bacterium]|nr:molecular chaperone DnaJ [Pseudomonadota bacterium]
MSQIRDYYEILGVSKNASDTDIKKAYRNLAREHHPDMVKDSDKAGAEKKFKEINEAYQVLSDSEKRKQYDQFGHNAFKQGGGAGASGFGGFGQGPFGYSYSTGNINVDPFEIFEEVFGFGGFGRPKKGKNIYYEVKVSFDEAVKGGERKIKVETGEYTIKIPKGIVEGMEMRFAGKGMPGPNNLPNGDLLVSFKVSFPEELERFNENILQVVEIDFIIAILGGEVEVKVIDQKSENAVSKKKIKVPEGVTHGTRLQLKGFGMPKINSNYSGDMFVELRLKLPKKLSRAQRKYLEEYKNIK